MAFPMGHQSLDTASLGWLRAPLGLPAGFPDSPGFHAIVNLLYEQLVSKYTFFMEPGSSPPLNDSYRSRKRIDIGIQPAYV